MWGGVLGIFTAGHVSGSTERKRRWGEARRKAIEDREIVRERKLTCGCL